MGRVRRFFTNDNIMLVLVLINTGIIFVSGFLPNQESILVVIDSFFTLMFFIEAMVKIQGLYWLLE